MLDRSPTNSPFARQPRSRSIQAALEGRSSNHASAKVSSLDRDVVVGQQDRLDPGEPLPLGGHRGVQRLHQVVRAVLDGDLPPGVEQRRARDPGPGAEREHVLRYRWGQHAAEVGPDRAHRLGLSLQHRRVDGDLGDVGTGLLEHDREPAARSPGRGRRGHGTVQLGEPAEPRVHAGDRHLSRIAAEHHQRQLPGRLGEHRRGQVVVVVIEQGPVPQVRGDPRAHPARVAHQVGKDHVDRLHPAHAVGRQPVAGPAAEPSSADESAAGAPRWVSRSAAYSPGDTKLTSISWLATCRPPTYSSCLLMPCRSRPARESRTSAATGAPAATRRITSPRRGRHGTWSAPPRCRSGDRPVHDRPAVHDVVHQQPERIDQHHAIPGHSERVAAADAGLPAALEQQHRVDHGRPVPVVAVETVVQRQLGGHGEPQRTGLPHVGHEHLGDGGAMHHRPVDGAIESQRRVVYRVRNDRHDKHAHSTATKSGRDEMKDEEEYHFRSRPVTFRRLSCRSPAPFRNVPGSGAEGRSPWTT